MSAIEATAPGGGGSAQRNRPPRQLLLAFFGEHIEHVEPLRASVIIEVLEGAGVAAPATRATLDRLIRRGILARQKRGREILFSLTDDGAALLQEASERVRGAHPFDAHGEGWTLVTFSVPEDRRTLRHRLRSALIWDGFAPIRDGLWIAPGEVDLASTLEPLRADLPPHAVIAFRAQELQEFSIAEAVRLAWDIEQIRDEHQEFIATWSDPAAIAEAPTALVAQTMLVADWLALLRADPRLPREYMGDEWPASRSVEVYQAAHRSLADPSASEFAQLVAGGTSS